MRKISLFLAALMVVAAPSALVAQESPLPRLSRDGVIAQVLVNPRGEPDGLLLRDGTLVRFPPHAVQDAALLRIGSQVHADGELATSPSGVTLFDAQVSANGRKLADDSAPVAPPPPPRAEPAQALSVAGKIRILLTNPDGVVDGFLLEDGTVVHAGPRARLSRLGVAPGVQVAVTGIGGSYPQGRSVHAQTLRIGDGVVLNLEARPPL